MPERAPAAGPSRISRQVADFHRAYQLEAADIPTVVGPAVAELRQALIDEEVDELRAAAIRSDVIGVADALADIVYVAYGTARVYGIDLDAVLDEVHSSNMTKLGADGRPIRRADGKVLKGPGYRPPDIATVLGLPPSGSVDAPTPERTPTSEDCVPTPERAPTSEEVAPGSEGGRLPTRAAGT